MSPKLLEAMKKINVTLKRRRKRSERNMVKEKKKGGGVESRRGSRCIKSRIKRIA